MGIQVIKTLNSVIILKVIEKQLWQVGNNLIHDFMAVTFSMNLAILCEKLVFPWISENHYFLDTCVEFSSFIWLCCHLNHIEQIKLKHYTRFITYYCIKCLYAINNNNNIELEFFAFIGLECDISCQSTALLLLYVPANTVDVGQCQSVYYIW